MTFDETIKAIFASCLGSKQFVEELKTWAVDFSTLPEVKYLSPLKQFLSDCDSNSFDYAVWKASKEHDIKAIFQNRLESPIAKAEFFKNAKNAQAEKLGVDILKNPSRVQELIDQFSARQVPEDEVVNLADVVEKVDFARKEKIASGQMIRSIRGWPKLSDHIGGFNAGRIAICMAQSGFGKTNLAVNIALAAQRTMKVLYVNMEMLIEDICERVFAITTSKSFSDIRKGAEVYADKLSLTLREGEELLMTTGRDKTLYEIEGLMRKYKAEFVVIDYDQKLLLEVNHQTPEWRALQFAMARFEELAKELKCFVLILAQTNLEGEISGSHRSRFSASSIWSFEKHDEFGAIIKFTKNRFGPIGKSLKVDYQSHCAKIAEDDFVVIVSHKDNAPKFKNKK